MPPNFRENLFLQEVPKDLKGLLKSITPPKGIKRGKNIEGSELLDGEEMEFKEGEQEDLDTETEVGVDSKPTVSQDTAVLLSNLCDDPEVNKDAKFVDDLHAFLKSHCISKIFIPYMSQLKKIQQNAGKSVMRRIEQSQQQKSNVQSTSEAEDTLEPVFDTNLIEDLQEDIETKPKEGEHWKVKHGSEFLYALIVKESPLIVKYYEPTKSGKFHSLNETEFDVFCEDLQEKIEAPNVVQKGKRKYYVFENVM